LYRCVFLVSLLRVSSPVAAQSFYSSRLGSYTKTWGPTGGPGVARSYTGSRMLPIIKCYNQGIENHDGVESRRPDAPNTTRQMTLMTVWEHSVLSPYHSLPCQRHGMHCHVTPARFVQSYMGSIPTRWHATSPSLVTVALGRRRHLLPVLLHLGTPAPWEPTLACAWGMCEP
jgi:hypothetical protein